MISRQSSFDLDHQRDDDRVLRVPPLALGDLSQVHLERPVGDQLDVVEPDHAFGAEGDGAEAAGEFDDRVAERFPDGAAPAGVERAHDLLAGVGGRGAGEPERIGRSDAGEVDGEVGHVVSTLLLVPGPHR